MELHIKTEKIDDDVIETSIKSVPENVNIKELIETLVVSTAQLFTKLLPDDKKNSKGSKDIVKHFSRYVELRMIQLLTEQGNIKTKNTIKRETQRKKIENDEKKSS